LTITSITIGRYVTIVVLATSSTETVPEGASSGSASSGSVDFFVLNLPNGGHGRTLTPLPKRRSWHSPRPLVAVAEELIRSASASHTRHTTEKLSYISKTFWEAKGKRGKGSRCTFELFKMAYSKHRCPSQFLEDHNGLWNEVRAIGSETCQCMRWSSRSPRIRVWEDAGITKSTMRP
jgi:hypothetical protein